MTNKIKATTILSDNDTKIIDSIPLNVDIAELKESFINLFNIEATDLPDDIKVYTQDYSNMLGYAELLVKPKTSRECAIILRLCSKQKYNITISAGKTNLTGSATPEGGLILSIENLNEYEIDINADEMKVSCSPNEYLESLREDVLTKTKNQLYYPVDPTSRVDAMISGTISCNASGFIPGEKGATRFWVDGIDIILPSGDHIYVQRGMYISNRGKFFIKTSNRVIEINIPRYNRPKIKNASGPFSESDGDMDFIDLIIGSEGIFCLISRCELRLSKKPNSYIDLFIGLDSENDAVKLHSHIGEMLDNNYGEISALEYFGYNCSDFMKNREYLFKEEADVGVYLQIPIFDISYDDVLDLWYSRLSNSELDIDFEKVLVLNEPENWKMFFEARHSLPTNALKRAKELGTVSIITDTIVPPCNFKQYLSFVHRLLQENNIEYLLFGHLGDCHLHFHLLPSKKNENKALNLYNDITKESARLGGVYSAEHGTGKRKRNDFIECYGIDAVSEIIRIKKVLDPSMILNRGNVIAT